MIQRSQMMKNKLYRCRDNAVFGGVVSGIAEYFQWTLDTSLLRVLLVILALFTNGILIVAYLVAWIIIPKKPIGFEDDHDPFFQ